MSLALTWSQDTWLEPATFRQDEETMDLELLREGGKEREGGKGGREGGRKGRRQERRKAGSPKGMAEATCFNCIFRLNSNKDFHHE